MSDRLTAPARSSLRRVGLQKQGSVEVALPAVERKPIRETAPVGRVTQLEREFAQLSPALQRFWQKAKNGELSPRSMRFTSLLPRPRHISSTIIEPVVEAEPATDQRRESLGIGCFLKAHFESLSPEQLGPSIKDMFEAFDSNHDGFLEINELKEAFHSLGKEITEKDGKHSLEGHHIDAASLTGLQIFETMVRASLKRPPW